MSIFDRREREQKRRSGIPAIDDLLEQLKTEPVPGRQELVDRFGISVDDFNVLYASYHMSLLLSASTEAGGDQKFDGFAREIGALSEVEIELARTSRHQAILNRIKVRLFTSTGQSGSKVS